MQDENFMPSFAIGYFNSKAAIRAKGIDIFDTPKVDTDNNYWTNVDIKKLGQYIQFRMRVRTRTETENFFLVGDFKMCSMEDFTN